MQGFFQVNPTCSRIMPGSLGRAACRGRSSGMNSRSCHLPHGLCRKMDNKRCLRRLPKVQECKAACRTPTTKRQKDRLAVERTAARTAETWSKVEVHKTRHLTGSQYSFTTDKNHVKATVRDDWKETEYKGRRAWYYRHKGVFYYTRVKP